MPFPYTFPFKFEDKVDARYEEISNYDIADKSRTSDEYSEVINKSGLDDEYDIAQPKSGFPSSY